MNYVYKNITTTSPQILIRKDSGGVTTIHKCQIANVDSSDATVGIYIESFSEDRTIKVLSSQGWQLQMDNELPKDLLFGESYYIPKETYHRVIKGKGDLVVEIITK